MPTFSFPTLIHFGPGVRKDVGAHLRSQGVQRPLLVTDKGLAALPLPQELIENLGAAGRTLLDRHGGQASEHAVDEARVVRILFLSALREAVAIRWPAHLMPL